MEKVETKNSIIPEGDKPFLGPEVCAAMDDLAVLSDDFEELVQSEIMTLPELMEYVELAGVLDLQKIDALAQAIMRRSDQESAKLSHITDANRRTKKINERWYEPFQKKLMRIQKGRPIFAFLVEQARGQQLLSEVQENMRNIEQGRKYFPGGSAAEVKFFQQYLKTGLPEEMFLILQLIWFVKKKQNVAHLVPDEAFSRAWYEAHRNEKFVEGPLQVKLINGPVIKQLGVLGAWKPKTPNDRALIPLCLAVFAIQTMTPEVDTLSSKSGQFFGNISRIDGELYLPGSITVSLKRVLEVMGAGGLYPHIKHEVYKVLAEKVASGAIAVEEDHLLELIEGPAKPIGAVQEETHANLAQTAPDLEPPLLEEELTEAEPEETAPEEVAEEMVKADHGYRKGVRTKLAGLEPNRVLATLAALGIEVHASKGGGHKILKQGRVIYPFPSHGQGKTTGNLARILGKALQKFSIPREVFLANY